MKIHKELTLSTYKKWDLIRYIIKLETTINSVVEYITKNRDLDNEKLLKLLNKENIL